jgi:hypothetical protein
VNEYCSDWDYFSNDSKIFLFVVLIDVEDNPHNFYFHNQHRIHRPKSPYISDGTALWINSRMDSLQSWKAGFQTLFLKVSLLVPNFSIFIFVFYSAAMQIFQSDEEVVSFFGQFKLSPRAVDQFLEFDTKTLLDGEVYSDSYLDLPMTGKDTSDAPRFSIVAPIGKK